MTVGNFDPRQRDPLNQGQTQPDPNDQIALLYGSCGTGGVRKASIYTVNPDKLRAHSYIDS